MKKGLIAGVILTFLFSMTANADVTTQITAAEEALGIDNSQKKAIERIAALEDELGISDSEGTLAERLAQIEKELGISDPDSESDVKVVSTEENSTEESSDETEAVIPGEELATAPTDDFVMERLKLISSITDMAAVTKDHDPNGKLNEQGGYIGCIYFADSQVDPLRIYVGEGEDRNDVIVVGTQGGGAVEVFPTRKEAEERRDYLATYDGTLLDNGSHEVVGTCVIRTSTYLTATEQKNLTEKIKTVLTVEEPSTIKFEETTEKQAETAAPEEEPTEYVLYDQDGYTISCIGLNLDPIDYKTITLKVTNLTHHNVDITETDSYVNGVMMSIGAYFTISSGKTQIQDCTIYGDDLKAAGIEQVEDITLNFDVYDHEEYSTLAHIGPLNITVDESGRIVNRTVYSDSATIKEVQTLLNAAGYDCGNPDGIAGKNTNNKILQFEKDHGLKEDTDITDELLEALRNAG